MLPRRAIRLLAIASLLLGVALSTEASAQVCFRGRPMPRCTGFAVLEFTAGARLNQQHSPFYSGDSPVYVSWNAGYLHNLGARTAVGAAFKVAADDDGAFYGPVLRYRQWLDPTWSLDLSAGLYVGGQRNFTALRFPSPTADVALNWGDRASLLIGMDVIRNQAGAPSWESRAGVRFGSWLAPIAFLGMVIAAGASYN